MSRASSVPTQHDQPDVSPEGVKDFAARSALGWLIVLVGVVPFLVLWLLVRDSSSALAALDRTIAAELNSVVSVRPGLVSTLHTVTELGGNATAIFVLTLTTVFMAVQRRWRLALFTAVTGGGLAVLVPVSKALIGRARPVVDVPLAADPGNASFPSGHSMTAIVLWGTLLVLTLPAVRKAARPWLIAAMVALVVVVGGTRLALGVHFLSDVLAGWALGAAWLAAMVVSFRTWPGAPHDHRSLDPMHQDSAEVVDVETPGRAFAPIHGREVARLAGVAALIAAVLVALGLLLTGPWQDTWIGRWDRLVVDYVVSIRSSILTDVATFVDTASDTPTVVGVSIAIAMLSLASTHSWRPALFVGVAVIGEVALYYAVSRAVGRPRPDVPDFTAGLPSGAAFPSGHAAAAVVLYGALAAVLVSYSTSSWRWAAVAAAVVVPVAVALSRVYTAAHYPTDVIAGLALGTAWLLACVHWLLPRGEAGTTRQRRLS